MNREDILEPFIGMVMPVAFGFVPEGWALCDGQLLPIADNTTLFSLLGTSFGGDGRVSFALPDLRGRSPRGSTAQYPGAKGGVETVTLNEAQMPMHAHLLNASQQEQATRPGPAADKVFAKATFPPGTLYGEPSAPVALSTQNIPANGGGQAHENMQPYLVVNYIIALQGLYPSRS